MDDFRLLFAYSGGMRDLTPTQVLAIIAQRMETPGKEPRGGSARRDHCNRSRAPQFREDGPPRTGVSPQTADRPVKTVLEQVRNVSGEVTAPSSG